MPVRKKKIAAAKEWYWEAEQDRIAADEDFKLIQSPADWPGEGLECVGLWFLLFNQMARSKRKGFLCDLVDTRKPMSPYDLAKLTGRSASVVLLVMNVLLERNLFSKNDQGIVYSRGLVRKEELRLVRSKAGKKGGLRSQVLLKQIVEQNTEQTLRIGILIPPDLSSPDGDFAQAKVGANEPAARLAFVYQSSVRGRRPEELSVCFDAFAEMIAMGVEEEAATVYLKKKPPARDRSEYLWQIKNKLYVAAGISVAKPKENLFGGLQEFVGKEQRNEQG